MAQKIFAHGIGGTGIVSVLIIAGIILIGTKASAAAGQIAIYGGVAIGLCLGFLGIFGVLKRIINF